MFISLTVGSLDYSAISPFSQRMTLLIAVADLYFLLLEGIHSGKPLAHGRNGFYFGENGEYVNYDLSKAVSEALYSKGKVKSTTPTAFTEDEMAKYYPGTLFFGANSRCKAERSRAIGWNPKKGDPEFLASVKEEVPN